MLNIKHFIVYNVKLVNMCLSSNKYKREVSYSHEKFKNFKFPLKNKSWTYAYFKRKHLTFFFIVWFSVMNKYFHGCTCHKKWLKKNLDSCPTLDKFLDPLTWPCSLVLSRRCLSSSSLTASILPCHSTTLAAPRPSLSVAISSCRLLFFRFNSASLSSSWSRCSRA